MNKTSDAVSSPIPRARLYDKARYPLRSRRCKSFFEFVNKLLEFKPNQVGVLFGNEKAFRLWVLKSFL